jgi:hypothetical protein
MNIVLINDNSAHLNWGAQASPPSLVKILQEAMPGCSIRTLPHEWLRRSYRQLRPWMGGTAFRPSRRRIIRVALEYCSKPAQFFPDVADDFDYRADEWLAGRGGPQGAEFLELAQAADVVVYNGENSIYLNTPEGCHGIFLLWLSKTRLGKPSGIVNHTAHLNDVRPIMTGMARLVFPVLDVVAVREPCSLRDLQSLGIRNAKCYPDVVFSLQPADFSRQRTDQWRRRHGLDDQSYFCLSASGLPMSMPRGAWDGEITAMVRDLKASGLQAVLVAKDPWCLPLAGVARRTDSLFFGPEHEYHDLWPLFEGASFLVSGHYHYVIFASMAGCPFVPLTVNNHKMKGVCELLGWERTEPFDATLLRECRTAIVAEAGRLRDQRSDLSARLLEKSAALREQAFGLGVRIAAAAQCAKVRPAGVVGARS